MSAFQPHARASAAYRNVAFAGAPGRQVVLLLDAAIRHVEAARAAIRKGRIEARFHAVMRAHTIVSTLQASLDFAQGGEVAPVLDRFYDHVLGRLALVNVRNDATLCDGLVAQLAQLRSSWDAITPGSSVG